MTFNFSVIAPKSTSFFTFQNNEYSSMIINNMWAYILIEYVTACKSRNVKNSHVFNWPIRIKITYLLSSAFQYLGLYAQ